MTTDKEVRRALLARIHIAQKQLWPKEDRVLYREMLRKQFDVDSAAKLDLVGLRTLTRYLEGRAGTSPRSSIRPNRPFCSPAKQPYINKILAILLNTPGSKKPGQDVLDYADATASEMFYRGQKIEIRVEWLEEGQLKKLIQALMMHKKRKEDKHGTTISTEQINPKESLSS